MDVAEKSRFRKDKPAPEENLHTPGGMAEPAAETGPSADGADLASTDMDANPSGTAEQPTSPDAGGEAESGTAAVEQLVGELEEWKDRFLRLSAEFDNYKKRVARERAELTDRAQASFAARLLDVLDDVDRLVAGDETTPVAALREGLVLVDRKLRKDLEAAGVERIDPVGEPFDPTEHEAVSVVPPPSPEQDHRVSATFQSGYRFRGNLIRPARVQVFSEQGHT